MRINRADLELWRARELQGTQRLTETSSPSLDKRFSAEAKKSKTEKRNRAARTEVVSAAPPLDDVLEQTNGNIVVLRYLIGSVLPELPMSEEVRQCAISLFTEDMDHHLRVLEAASQNDRKQEMDGKSGES